MNLKTEAQLTQELSEVWRLLEAERTGFSRIIAEKDKEIERLRKALQLIASEGGKSRETECGIIQCNGAWCADQAYWAIQEDSDATSSRSPDPK